jgi:hypothetical protein
MRVVMAQITSFQSRMFTSSSTTTMNLVYMNCRRKLHSPNITPLGVARHRPCGSEITAMR